VPDHGEKHVTAINRDIADLAERQVNTCLIESDFKYDLFVFF